MIGDPNESSEESKVFYKNYFACGCHPNLTAVEFVVVSSVEHKLDEELDKCALGSAMLEPMSVKQIMGKLTENQGCIVEGPKEHMFDKVLQDISEMMRAAV